MSYRLLGLYSYEKILKLFVYFTFGLIPVSFILGNTILNSNIILCCIFLILVSIKYKSWEWIKNKLFISLLVFWTYLFLNSLYQIIFNIDHQYIWGGLIRSLGFIKFVILSCSFLVFKNKNINFGKIINIWFILILIILFDVFFEKIFGKNLFGYISPDHTRIVSFFKDELVVGGFLFCFGFISTAYILNRKSISLYNKKYLFILFFVILFAIFLTGERSNFIKSFIFLFLIMFLIFNNLFKHKRGFVILFIFLISLTLIFNKNVNNKYLEFFDRIKISESKGFDKFENIKYFSHYKVSINIFKDNILLGVGNKNFRWSCHDKNYYDKSEKFSSQRCSTHPHQIHFELLSEQGLIGYILFFSIILKFIYSAYKNKLKKNNFFKKILCIYLIIFLIPILPSGSIFSTFGGSYFWFTLSILNYINEDRY